MIYEKFEDEISQLPFPDYKKIKEEVESIEKDIYKACYLYISRLEEATAKRLSIIDDITLRFKYALFEEYGLESNAANELIFKSAFEESSDFENIEIEFKRLCDLIRSITNLDE